jgi:hypothetical protein
VNKQFFMFGIIMAEQINNSYLFYIDSDNSLTGSGDNFQIQTSNMSIHANDGEEIRFHLDSFNMYKNWLNVNVNNNRVHLDLSDGSNTSLTAVDIPAKNYKTVGDIASAFATALGDEVLSVCSTFGSSAVSFTKTSLPITSATIDDTSDRIIDITLTFNAVHTLTTGAVQCYESVGDSGTLLGARRIPSPTVPTVGAGSSFIVTYPTTTTMRILGYYPAQRSTEEYVYLRTDLPNFNIESEQLSSSVIKTRGDQHAMPSDIIARIPIDHEFCHYESQTGREFFLNIPNKQVNAMKFYLRDSHDRPLPSIDSQQGTVGNLHFSMVLRVDVIQKYVPNKLNSGGIIRTTPALKSGLFMPQNKYI